LHLGHNTYHVDIKHQSAYHIKTKTCSQILKGELFSALSEAVKTITENSGLIDDGRQLRQKMLRRKSWVKSLPQGLPVLSL
jgi:hypothetical protein